MQLNTQVDLLELKDYKDVDLDETPIVALACGHFFTIETLDGRDEHMTRALCSADRCLCIQE
jgi:hypothetical protein